MKKRRSKKTCKYLDTEQSKIGYCTHPKASKLFCDGVCDFFKKVKEAI